MSAETHALLLLVEAGVAVEQGAVEAIVALDEADEPPWLPAIERPTSGGDRRVLRLFDGRRFEVPASMRTVEVDELLAPPALLEPAMRELGLIGFALLQTGLTPVCDPRRIARPGDPPR